MPKIKHDGKYIRAKEHRLTSNIAAYEYQMLYISHKPKVMQWLGIYPNGFPSGDPQDIPETEHATWEKRIESDRALPEAQMMSEWSERAARPADVALQYQGLLDWCRKYVVKPEVTEIRA